MKKKILLGALVWGSLPMGCKSPQQAATACIDPAKIDKERACTMQYEPVCGCDGKTYGNACTAEISGVTSYKPGECPTKGTNN